MFFILEMSLNSFKTSPFVPLEEGNNQGEGALGEGWSVMPFHKSWGKLSFQLTNHMKSKNARITSSFYKEIKAEMN